MLKLAIVILNWNGADMMRKYLPSVIGNSCGEGVEVIVADNASDDDSIDMLRTDFPATRVIRLDKNYGFAEGYNRALAQVEAEYYLLLNSDIEIRQDGWTKPLTDYMDAHPECGACQPKVMSLRNPAVFEYAGAAGGFIDKYGYPYCRGRVFATVEKDLGQYDSVARLMWATGAALMVRSDCYNALGGLDNAFFAHMEEIDLCWRVRNAGYSIVCIPGSTVYHLGGATLNQGNPYKTYLNFRNNLLMLFKNLPDAELKPVMRVRMCLDLLAAAQFMAKGDWGNCKAVFKARKAFKQMKPAFVEVRKAIREQSKVDVIPERKPFSLLWQYYVKGRKKFSDLPQ